MLRGRAAMLLVVVVGAFAWNGAPSVRAADSCDTTWTGTAAGDWETPARWTHGIPGPADVACVPSGGVVWINQTSALGEEEHVTAALIDGTLNVGPGGKLFAEPASSGTVSHIQTLNLDQGILGGSAHWQVTGTWTLQSTVDNVATLSTRDLEDINGAPPTPGSADILAGARVVVTDSGVSCPGQRTGVNLRDEWHFVNHGTFIIDTCAFVAADWGTVFENDGTVQLASGFGYYEGFIKQDLPWETSPPLFVNNASIAKTGASTFVLAARYSGAGTITVPANGNVTLPDHAPALAAGFRTAPRATAALGGECGAQLCTLAVTAANPVLGAFRNATSVGAASKVLLSQNPSDRTGTTYATTARPGGTFAWKVAKGSLAFTQTTGRATAADPDVVAITLDKTLVKGKAASEFGVGYASHVIDACSKPGHALPCLQAATLDGKGDLHLTIKTTGPSGKQIRMYPLGPRLYK